MKSELIIYIKQRFNLALFTGLALYIFLFNVPLKYLNIQSLVALGILLFSLFVLRLYDDLMQFKYDKGKPNRNYTQLEIRNILFIYWIILAIVLLGLAALISVKLSLTILTFLILNHVIYLLLINLKKIASILPLLKYLVFCGVLQVFYSSKMGIDFPMIASSGALFFVFLTYETLEDPGFIFPFRFNYVFQIISYILILFLKPELTILLLMVIFLSISLLSVYFKTFKFPYLFLLLILFFKFIITNYVI